MRMSAKWTSRAIFSIAILAALGSGASRLVAQTAPRDSLTHVELLVQTPFGEPVGYLTAKDFVATESGQRLPVEVVSPRLGIKAVSAPSVPTRMLLLLDTQTSNSPDGLSRIVAALEPAWRRGWQVSVARIDGNASGYAASARELQQNWTTLATSSMKTETAIRGLEALLGRRVVLYVGDVGQDEANLPRWLYSDSQNAMAELLIVDTYTHARQSEGRDTLAGLAHAAEHGGGGYMPDTMGTDKLSLHAAIRKALHGALGYYDLRLHLPSGAGPTLSLQIRKAQDLKVLSQVFGQGTTPELRITTK